EQSPDPEQGVEYEHCSVCAVGMERGGQRVERRDGEPETEADKRGGHEQQRIRDLLVVRVAGAGQQQSHRDEAAGEPGQVYRLEPGPAGKPGPAQRRDDREYDLRQENRAVLGAGQVVLLWAGEDGAGGWEGDQHDALRGPGRVDNIAFQPGGHVCRPWRPRRSWPSTRWLRRAAAAGGRRLAARWP